MKLPSIELDHLPTESLLRWWPYSLLTRSTRLVSVLSSFSRTTLEEKKTRFVRDQKGQATTEYILLVSIIVGFYMALTAGLNKIGITKKLSEPLQKDFAATYQYGHPKAKGFGDGAPTYHPRIIGGEKNFRIFFNPDQK